MSSSADNNNAKIQGSPFKRKGCGSKGHTSHWSLNDVDSFPCASGLLIPELKTKTQTVQYPNNACVFHIACSHKHDWVLVCVFLGSLLVGQSCQFCI